MADGSADKGFDVATVRADFPILSRAIHGKPLTYLDNAASAQKPRQVLDTVRKAYESEYANVHRGLHTLSNLATQNFEDARETVRRFLNARQPGEISTTSHAQLLEGPGEVFLDSLLTEVETCGDLACVADDRLRAAGLPGPR